MQTKKLLTIGEISKISGAHIKSLRYYDKIGILKPAYVDPATSYRYYTWQQLVIVDTIQMCVELDIPLRQFDEFTENGGQKICYAKLLEHGKALAEKKIHTIRESLRLIEAYREELKFGEDLKKARKNVIRNIPKKRYYVKRFEGAANHSDHYSMLSNLYLEATAKGLEPGYEFGLLYIYENDSINRYQAIEIEYGKGQSKQLLTVPAGEFMSKCIQQSKIEAATTEFAELFARNSKRIILETELFSEDYNILEPRFELRCSMS